MDINAHVLEAATYFTTLAAQLRESRIGEGNGTDGVVRQLEEEAGRPVRAVGGSTGGSGHSNS